MSLALAQRESPYVNDITQPSIDRGTGPSSGTRSQKRPPDSSSHSNNNPGAGSEWGGKKRWTGGGKQYQDSTEGNTEMQFLDYFSLDRQEVLGHGRTGWVMKACWQGEEVAVKVCDTWKQPDIEKELLNEVKIYNVLEDIQGLYIPRLKTAGYAWGNMLFAIATEIVGVSIRGMSLRDVELQKIVEALSAIHHHGILHNDIHKDNILIQPDNGGFRVSFIDFALSERTFDEKILSQEMAELRGMLGLQT